MYDAKSSCQKLSVPKGAVQPICNIHGKLANSHIIVKVAKLQAATRDRYRNRPSDPIDKQDAGQNDSNNSKSSSTLIIDKQFRSAIIVKGLLRKIVKEELNALLLEVASRKKYEVETRKLAMAISQWYGHAQMHRLGMALAQLRRDPTQYTNLTELAYLAGIPLTTIRRPKFKRLLEQLNQSELIIWRVEGKRNNLALNWSNECVKCLLPLWKRIKLLNIPPE